MDWRIYYADGSTFDSSMGLPHEAPSDRFICAVGFDEADRRYIMHGCDWYAFHADQWWPFHTFDGLVNHLRHHGVYAFKTGETITRTAYEELMAAADGDHDFPRGGR